MDLLQNHEPTLSLDIRNCRSEPAAAPKSNYRNVALLRSKHPNQASVALAQTAGFSQKGASKKRSLRVCLPKGNGFCNTGSTDQYLLFVWVAVFHNTGGLLTFHISFSESITATLRHCCF